MKKRIIAYLSLLFIFFTIGAVTSMIYITFTTSQLKNIISLHSVEILRQNLVIKIQNVEQDLLTVHTELGSHLDKIVLNVTELDGAVNRCTECHHSPLINEKLHDIKERVEKFKTTLSYYITASANEAKIRALKSESYKEGTELFDLTTEMAIIANQKLQDRTHKAIFDVETAQKILVITLFLALLIGLWIAFNLTRNITRPVKELIDVSRKIASGSLGYTTKYTDATEFGELAASFNEMSLSLQGSNEKILQSLNKLTGLYRITLPLHTVSNLQEISREVSYGVADIIEVEQCGLMLFNPDSGLFEHTYPAVGLDEAQAVSIKIPKEDILQLFLSSNRRPFVLNSVDAEKLPPGLMGSTDLRNMLLGWVRQKGELIGVIRLANQRNGDFYEESARLVGILSNNVSVAIENIKLYEDLKTQMSELRETQGQLVQAAKLAAIGELASNVAHEINNPLTSIMGYAELIKEEDNIENIMRDIDIIEKESIRARDIVQQLLEFARKKPLEIIQININDVVKNVVSLIRVQLKDNRIHLTENYADLSLIPGDPNQLKQVFLNLISNAVDALSEKGGEIKITTESNRTGVIVEISDNGKGIPEEVLPRIFEPFFTTKKDKGTGLGLSITYKIIQSHKGRIDVASEWGKGTKFTVYLPV